MATPLFLMTFRLILWNSMKLQDYLKEIEQFVKNYLAEAHMQKYVLGLSGGVDSSLVAAITKNAVGKEHLICVAMPIESNQNDLSDAQKVAKQLDINLITIDGTNIFNAAKNEFKNLGIELNTSTLSNLKVRIRMTLLYALAQKENALVIGTDNADERYTGYFTKYGDGAVDLLPIAYLLKKEVVEACRIYGLSEDLCLRIPSAGLFEGQTDEGEMGIKYDVLDNFLLGNSVDENSLKRINHLHNVSEHKRAPIPTPKPFKRD